MAAILGWANIVLNGLSRIVENKTKYTSLCSFWLFQSTRCQKPTDWISDLNITVTIASVSAYAPDLPVELRNSTTHPLQLKPRFLIIIREIPTVDPEEPWRPGDTIHRHACSASETMWFKKRTALKSVPFALRLSTVGMATSIGNFPNLFLNLFFTCFVCWIPVCNSVLQHELKCFTFMP